MPKPIKYPPVLIVMDTASILREKILLWSFGLDEDRIHKSYAAVLYGRARWIGPLFKGEQITKNNLSNILLVIGADCECGLDKNWLQGTMLPLRWDKKCQVRVAKSLGFDPENPMIKMEISRIMRMGYFYPEGSNGRRENLTMSDQYLESSKPTDTKSDNRAPAATGIDVVSEKSVMVENNSPLKKSIFITAGIVTIIVISGLIIVFRRAKKNS